MRDASEGNGVSETQTTGVSRRRALKAGAGLAIGTAVWAEPTIKGLATRPAYAAGGSGGVPTVYTISPISSTRVGNGQGGGLPKIIPNNTPVQLELVGPGPGGSNAYVVGGTYTLVATLNDPLTGNPCVCTFNAGSGMNAELMRFNDGSWIAGSESANTITWIWPGASGATNIANRIRTTATIAITCV